MNEPIRRSRRMTAPIHWIPVNPDSTYSDSPDGPIEFLSIELGERIVGYLWFSDAEYAAGYTPRESMGDIAFNVGFVWAPKLKEAKANGMLPSEAVLRLASSADLPSSVGSIASPETRSVRNLRELSTVDD